MGILSDIRKPDESTPQPKPPTKAINESTAPSSPSTSSAPARQAKSPPIKFLVSAVAGPNWPIDPSDIAFMPGIVSAERQSAIDCFNWSVLADERREKAKIDVASGVLSEREFRERFVGMEIQEFIQRYPEYRRAAKEADAAEPVGVAEVDLFADIEVDLLAGILQ